MGKVSKLIMGGDRAEAGARLLALSHVSMGLVNRYPHRIQDFVQYQHETAMNTAQVLAEEERQRQAAKKANRMKNRAMIGAVAGAGLGGVTGGWSIASMSAGAKFGSSFATGDFSGLAGSDISGVSGGLGTKPSSKAQLTEEEIERLRSLPGMG